VSKGKIRQVETRIFITNGRYNANFCKLSLKLLVFKNTLNTVYPTMAGLNIQIYKGKFYINFKPHLNWGNKLTVYTYMPTFETSHPS